VHYTTAAGFGKNAAAPEEDCFLSNVPCWIISLGRSGLFPFRVFRPLDGQKNPPCVIIRQPSVISGRQIAESSKVKAMTEKLKAVEASPNPNIPEIHAGDTVSVHVRIREGDKERIQEFRGTVIRLRKGGNQTSVTVRRVAAHGIGVERTFPLRSPRLDRVIVQKGARVRRAQLYFLRGLKGKRARLHGKSEGA
jgi:large subunit ribosomal protein L19